MFTQSTQSSTTPTTNQTSASTNITKQTTSDFETFLKMLTVQAQNQDPLKPLDSSEYAAHLAQFSMVEQQTKTNQTLDALVSKLGGAGELSSWIGKEARAIAPANFNGDPITVSPAPRKDATEAVLVVRDAAGTVVDRQSIPVSTAPVKWTGLDASGNARPSGLYSFAVESRKNGEVMGEDAAAAYNKIVEAQMQNGEVTLIMDGGQAILASKVTALRALG